MSHSKNSERGMIFLQPEHPIIYETVLEKCKASKHEPVDISCSDFDDVKYKIVVNSDSKSVMTFSLSMPCYKNLMQMGASSVIDSVYSNYISGERLDGYDVCFKIDVDKLKESPEVVAKKFGEIKANLLGAPFKRSFEALSKGGAGSLKPMVIPYRPKERMVLVPGSDRVNVYFVVHFADETDRAIARVFLQEFSESQRKIPQAPNVSFSTECPSDLNKVSEFKAPRDAVGYLMFQVFKSHVEGSKLTKAITLFQGFRAYLHYHIKASKAHLHARMRKRVNLLLQVLRRADPNSTDESKKKNYRTYN